MFLARRSGHSMFIRTSSNRWAENFALDGWALGTRCLSSPAATDTAVPSPGGFRASGYLSCGWLESLPQHAASVGAAPRIPPPGASPRTTENTQVQSWVENVSQSAGSSFSSEAVFVVCFCFFNWKENHLRNIRTSQGIWGAQLLTMSDSFILMVILLTASVALLNILRRPAPLKACVPTARGSYKTKKAGMASYLLPLF